MAKALFAEGNKLQGAFAKDLERAKTGTEQVLAQLAKGGKAAEDTAEVKTWYDEAQRAQLGLYNRNWSLAAQTLVKLMAIMMRMLELQSQDATSPVPAKDALIEMPANDLDLPISQIAWTAAFIELHSSVAACTEACEAYLGRRVGSRQWGKRFLEVGKTFVTDLAGVVVAFGFLSTVAEGVEQLQFDPIAEGMKEEVKRAEGAAKVVEFKKLADHLTERTQFVEAVISSQIEQFETSMAGMAEGFPRLRQILDAHSPKSP